MNESDMGTSGFLVNSEATIFGELYEKLYLIYYGNGEISGGTKTKKGEIS